MNITIHRGTHQIGGSFIELATENTRIILDVGQELPPLDGNSAGVSPPPPIAGLFSAAQEKVDAVLISHYHGDHIGHIGEIQSDIPVFMGEKAARIFNTTSKFTRRSTLVNPTGYLIDGQEIIIGDFSITPYLVDHSAFDAYAFVVKTRG